MGKERNRICGVGGVDVVWGGVDAACGSGCVGGVSDTGLSAKLQRVTKNF